MQFSHQVDTTSLELLYQQLEHRCGCVMWSIDHPDEALVESQEIGKLLAALPLASSDYCTASNRLRNVQRFLVADEPGAASWELRHLSRSMQRHRHQVASPRRLRRQRHT